MSVNHDISVPNLDPERTLELVLEAVAELVDYELAVVLSLDSSDTLRVRKAAGPLHDERLSGFSLSLADRGDIAGILRAGKPKLFSEDEEHVDTYEQILDLPAGHSCMVAPLVVAGKPIGLLTLDHRSCGMFTPGIVRFIATISRLISLSLAKADQVESLAMVNADLVRERNALLTPGYEPIAGMVGSSAVWTKAVEALRLVAGSELPVLILGETGTGKELAARSVHRLSGRASKPFVAINCSALAPSLAESELFGHEKGSFTGAQSLRRGRFELADGGTLFLDEIGDLPLDLQPKLLRALQEGSFERLGGEKPVRVNVRVVAATHVDLEAAVSKGRFRADLYYRLSVFPVTLPPLRERHGDVVLIAERFVASIRERPGMEKLTLGDDAIPEIESRTWPGNIRELRNALERAAILARGARITAEHLIEFRPPLTTGGGPFEGRSVDRPAPQPPITTQPMAVLQPRSLAQAQREAIRSALVSSGGKVYGPGGAAELLGMKPSTLQSAMKRLGINKNSAVRGEEEQRG
ncbi:MAG: sigma 54-interacting transcriptional regulator [Spirochaetales bacterium]|nr:sigma 54-interacting transcriptional regulator [Spirochaetales bacterium]